MNNVIQGIFGSVSPNHLLRQALTEIPHGPNDVLRTNGRAVKWMPQPAIGWNRFGNVVAVTRPEPPCAA